ncbi:tetraspanin-18-like [Mya arenaria]|uniref:tetraspanin-18-like n=1 Tax=Mya arenaria TaxID=6604 RepID=UPI0022E3879C|nr:tetraspanin-18-like [Mya arenaria]XP_052761506.1 tetraspanin-18-like [Mya arenaria]XP_052761507.1 tetraspanin-18-like [Mya arenaria]XP_052761508.1 tetraspanin-18-like [Mya arenaria]XP_052761509.1 tetraspanin-18-like [Mya arenaria]
MVELSCGKSCMKYILFVINFIFFVLGAAAFGLGIWALVDKNKMNVLTKVGAADSNFDVTGLLESAAIVLLVGGACILVIGFLGCCGAFKQSQCLLCLYAICLLLIVIIELAAIVIAAVFRGKVTTEVKGFLKDNIKTTYQGKVDTNEEFSIGLDYAQVYFQCCGIDGSQDFNNATKWNRTATDPSKGPMVIPPTCCKMNSDKFLKDQVAELEDTDCPWVPTTTNSNQNKACWDSIEKYLKDRISVVIGIAAGILVLELICVVFACCIISAIRKDSV